MEKFMPAVLAVLLAVCVVRLIWIMLLRPRRGQPGWEVFQSARFAHRGLHDLAQGRPENSMSAFRAAVEKGFGAELDIHLMADGNLAVVHDSNLARTCGKNVRIEDLTAADLKDCYLDGTAETIPLFEDVLALFAGKTPLIVELKAERGNASALTDAAMAMLARWNGTYCVESFHPAALLRLKAKYPDVIRGQLSQNFMKGSEVGGLPWIARFLLTHLLTTVFTRPDFIAYNCLDRNNASLRLMKRLYGVHEVAWTVRDRGTMEQLEGEGVPCIFEKFVP